MRMRKTALPVMALLVVFSALVACASGGTLKIGWRGSDTRRHKWARYTSFSGVERKSLRLGAGQTVRLDYEVEVEQGTLKISLVDPDGETLWEKTFEEGQADAVEVSVSQGGRHRLRIEGDKTRGSYDLSWDVEDA